jgi:hypothetical protein
MARARRSATIDWNFGFRCRRSLLLQQARIAIEWILLMREGLPLRRTWIERPYGEEEVALLEEEVLPAIRECLERVDQIDDELLATI